MNKPCAISRPMFIFLLIPLISFAAVQKYDLNLSYAVREEAAVKGSMALTEGKKVVMEGKDHSLEIIAEEGKIMNRTGILLSFNVLEVRKDGKRSVLTQPKLLVNENEEAQITIDDVALTVTAKRKK